MNRKSIASTARHHRSIPLPAIAWIGLSREPFGATCAAMKNPLPGCKYDRPFYYVTLLPVEKPTVEQIKRFREVALGQKEMNFLQLRAILEYGGFAAFGLLLPTQLSALTCALDAVGIRYAVHKDDTPRLLL
ncbi:MAG: hypothetical protein ACYC6Y_28645 [Thermoguttaceae bacterium]